MQRIVPCLWFDGAAEEAACLYTSLVEDSALGPVLRYPRTGFEIHGGREGSVLTVDFRLGDSRLVALNGGPAFRFTPALSLFVTLPTGAAVDRLWSGLAEGGSVLMPLDRYPWSPRYGWVADRWGMTWQIAQGDHAEVGRTVVPSLLFTGDRLGQAEAALRLYADLFPGTRIDGVLRHDGTEAPAGLVKHAQARLGGADPIMVMEGPGPGHAFTEAVSLMALCETQAEIDRLWSALSAVPEAEACGWLKDRFGVSWQIVPHDISERWASADPDRRERMMAALLTMTKLDIAAFDRAAA